MIRIKSLSQLDRHANSEGKNLVVFSESPGKALRLVDGIADRLEVNVLHVDMREMRDVAREYGVDGAGPHFYLYKDGDLKERGNGTTTKIELGRMLRRWYR
ncbi:MAG TPA: thioredoxin domain-containing protein [Candidatus Nanoarchaeia archaeon]|nr:thioredoxin domain-containing protein [Candidatus Nanoarchaeia archaeon]